MLFQSSDKPRYTVRLALSLTSIVALHSGFTRSNFLYHWPIRVVIFQGSTWNESTTLHCSFVAHNTNNLRLIYEESPDQVDFLTLNLVFWPTMHMASYVRAYRLQGKVDLVSSSTHADDNNTIVGSQGRRFRRSKLHVWRVQSCQNMRVRPAAFQND